MRSAVEDRLRVMLACPRSALAAVERFYCETLGFEPEHRREEEGATLVGLRLDGTRLLLATPGAFDIGPAGATTNATVILMHPDPVARRRALGARYDGAMSEVRAMGAGSFYELVDPCGNRVWIMQVE